MVKVGVVRAKNFPSASHAILWKPPSSFSGYTPALQILECGPGCQCSLFSQLLPIWNISHYLLEGTGKKLSPFFLPTKLVQSTTQHFHFLSRETLTRKAATLTKRRGSRVSCFHRIIIIFLRDYSGPSIVFRTVHRPIES